MGDVAWKEIERQTSINSFLSQSKSRKKDKNNIQLLIRRLQRDEKIREVRQWISYGYI